MLDVMVMMVAGSGCGVQRSLPGIHTVLVRLVIIKHKLAITEIIKIIKIINLIVCWDVFFVKSQNVADMKSLCFVVMHGGAQPFGFEKATPTRLRSLSMPASRPYDWGKIIPEWPTIFVRIHHICHGSMVIVFW